MAWHSCRSLATAGGLAAHRDDVPGGVGRSLMALSRSSSRDRQVGEGLAQRLHYLLQPSGPSVRLPAHGLLHALPGLLAPLSIVLSGKPKRRASAPRLALPPKSSRTALVRSSAVRRPGRPMRSAASSASLRLARIIREEGEAGTALAV